MNILSNVMNKVPAKVEYDGGHLQILNINGFTAVQEKDMVVCIPYLVEQNKIIMRYEDVPTYNLIKPEMDKFITVMSTVMEKDEFPKDALKRGLEKEFMIKLKDSCNPEILDPIFINKGNTAMYHICILPLMTYDYEQEKPSDDMVMEMKASNILININELNNYIIYDLITRYTMDLFKKEYSLF